MADLTAIQDAVYELAIGDVALMALVSDVYYALAPASPTYPYMVFQIIDAVDSYDYDATFDTVRIQVDIYDQSDTLSGAATVNSCLSALDTAFDFQTVTDASLAYFDGKLIPQETRILREGTTVWRASRDYIVLLEKR